MASEPVITFSFSGGDADANQLNFYDASRFQYGAARLLYTLEHYRQTRRVLGRISTKVKVDFRIGTPEPGSWYLDILQIASVPLAEMLIKILIDVLTAYVMDRLTSSRRPQEIALAIEQERTAQSIQETERMRLYAENQRLPLEILQEELRDRRRSDEEVRNIRDSVEELKCTIERRSILEPYLPELGNIPAEEEQKLLQKAHSQLAEVGRPLIASARELRVEGAHSDQPFGYMNRRHVEALSGNVEDELPTLLRGSITRYDKENGWGKFRHPEASQPISFVIPGAVRNFIGYDIIDAMKEREVFLSFYYVRNKQGTVKYMILDKIVQDDEYEAP